MNEMELLRELRAGLPPARAQARAAARGALVARIQEGERPRPRRRLRWTSLRSRILLAGGFVAALAVAAVALGVFADGNRVETAAAQSLHRTAAVAEGSDAPALKPPAPGQFLYTKTKIVQLQGWLRQGHLGSKDEPRIFTPHAGDPYPQALVSTVVEKWTAPDGAIRQRETLGPIRFFSAADQRDWEEAGSPPPWSFDPRFQDAVPNRSGRLEKDFETRKWAPDVTFPDPSKLPQDPKRLRRAVELGQVRPPWVLDYEVAVLNPETGAAEPAPADRRLGPEETIERLFEILEKPTTTPALRAAAFNALAEIPEIRLSRNVTDVAGRRGDAITLRSKGSGIQSGFTFDPKTAELIARGETVVNPKAIDRSVPVGAPFRQIAFLESGIVDSKHETAGEADGPVATTDPARSR